MRRLNWTQSDDAARRDALARPAMRADERLRTGVAAILSEIREGGEPALNAVCERLDGSPLRRIDLADYDETRIDAALSSEDRAALETAWRNIVRFHDAQRPSDSAWVETAPGVEGRRVWRPLQTAGLYVPGGTAPLLSTLLMLAAPAQAAGVERLVVVTPPDAHGRLHPGIAAAAKTAGLDTVWLIGGAQAVAAMAYGVGLPACDKVFGPGNAWVSEAKRQVSQESGGPAIDMPAGPSELMVVADASADPDVVAADLLSQAEHDRDAQIVLASLDAPLTGAVEAALEDQLRSLPRAEIARASLDSALIIDCERRGDALAAVQTYAPEHLSLNLADAEAFAEGVTRAGTVFIGAHASESFGDYCAGPNHVLPTDGAARAWSGLSVDSFMRAQTLHRVSEAGAKALAPTAARLARLEGLEAHARAADIRT